MQPWERRLRDLANLLAACGSSCLSPDLFRQNTNRFLQTSRTVTFIIQKHKASVPSFSSWSDAAVLTPWSSDAVMTWAKDARNVIEKEGDLDMHSSLRASLVFSHLPSQGAVVATTRKELLDAGVDKLLRPATTELPPGLADAAVLRVERRWVANSLPTHEPLAAMTDAYARLFDAVDSLARHLNGDQDSSIRHPTRFDPTSTDATKVRYTRLGAPGVSRLKALGREPNFRPPAPIEALAKAFSEEKKRTSLIYHGLLGPVIPTRWSPAACC